MKINLESIEFPSYRANWAPVFFEPISGSGERLTIGIVLIDRDGVEIKRTINNSLMKKLFREKFAHVLKMTEFIFDGLRSSSIDNSREIALPLSGFKIGSWTEASSGLLRDGVFKQAVYQSSALANMSDFEVIDTKLITKSNDRFKAAVKKNVIKIRPDLSRAFNASVKLVPNGVPIKLGFLHSNGAANFGRLGQRSLNASFMSLRAKLHELHHVKQADLIKHGQLIIPSPVKVGHLEAYENNDIARAITELKHEANKDGLELKIANDNDHAASLIFALIEAA
jgi:hypothetical protein